MRYKTLLVRLPYADYTAVVDRAVAHDRYPDQELRVIVRAGLTVEDPTRSTVTSTRGDESRGSSKAVRQLVAP